MIRLPLWLAALLAVCLVLESSCSAHSGRRFSIEVVNGPPAAQGINTGPDDGAPFIRPYLNAIHDHWSLPRDPKLCDRHASRLRRHALGGHAIAGGNAPSSNC